MRTINNQHQYIFIFLKIRIFIFIVGPVLLKNVQDSTNTRDLDKKIVQMPRVQPGYMGKISVSVVVLIFLFTIQNVNIKIKTTTENLPT